MLFKRRYLKQILAEFVDTIIQVKERYDLRGIKIICHPAPGPVKDKVVRLNSRDDSEDVFNELLSYWTEYYSMKRYYKKDLIFIVTYSLCGWFDGDLFQYKVGPVLKPFKQDVFVL